MKIVQDVDTKIGAKFSEVCEQIIDEFNALCTNAKVDEELRSKRVYQLTRQVNIAKQEMLSECSIFIQKGIIDQLIKYLPSKI